MSQEFEAQVLDINKKKVRQILKEIGGKRVHKMFKMIRCAYELCAGDTSAKGFARVRTEYSGTTMTVKIYNNKDFPEEYEISIKEDFETGKKFLDALNLKVKAYQETYREKWRVPIEDVNEITIDLWPGLPPYMEIDCNSEKALNKVIKLFNVSKDKISYGPSARKYESYYGIDPKVINEKTPRLTFKDVKKQIIPLKNKELFNKVFEKYKKK
jgi:adenylate cyclase class 2